MFAKINDMSIFFDVVGEKLDAVTSQLKEKPTVVVVHGGLGFDHGYLRPGLDPLALPFNLIYWDMRGQGRSSDVPLESITLENCADDAKALCDYLGIKKAFFLGHSAGGFVSLMVALRHPDLVEGLVLCNTSAGHQFTPGEKESQKTPTLVKRAPQEVVSIATKLFMPASLEEMMDKKRIEVHRKFLNQVGPYYLAPGNENMFLPVIRYSVPTTRVMDHFVANIIPNYDLSDEIQKITVPTLIISGEHDWVCPPISGRFIANKIVNSLFVLFNNSGHMPFIEEPERFDDLVVEFIRNHSE
ncbi:hypothetical protein C1Y41_04615 [Pantoea sp. ICBG 1758]|uniref:alpha/beta fold hydrolase n=1 Tax=Pantoea sp. ICBG 1758 TaxID=2071682 RepID=UPI000CE40325|nr:alpha/beta hydrolase [Pantoea sp. ICBG 1758]PPC63931.1 hypothetical protein C1Y41_04615 [Pantoea sp. ICBG 1758]